MFTGRVWAGGGEEGRQGITLRKSPSITSRVAITAARHLVVCRAALPARTSPLVTALLLGHIAIEQQAELAWHWLGEHGGDGTINRETTESKSRGESSVAAGMAHERKGLKFLCDGEVAG
ncbi:hypothetical protein E2C01_001090 [Portunus trituberculatus]|uniref:Uncharacterized protein n=1 Tax=Portunus trituberculatus TaxID=210409 RepID=A0A5B7CIH4_PORTR|nr:hypothetical protein [Portunus trituberculatus]